MQNSWTGKRLLTLALGALIAGALWHFFSPEARKPADLQLPTAKSDFKYHYTPPVLANSATDAVTEPERDRAGQPKIPREKVEAWLAKHNRNAISLLAAFRALEDTNYLNEAAANFPNDPRVELAVLARNAFPEDRRKWLDLFKTSSPSNSLANYFSAEEYFQNGKADAAAQELVAASGKPQFDNRTTETLLDAQELYLAAGQSPKDANTRALADMSGEDLPELATIKRLDNGIADLLKQKIDSGDAESAVNLAQMGLALADKLNSGESGKLLINQLVGMATEAYVLNQLDQNTAYDFLNGQTPAQVLQQLKEQKAAYRQLATAFQAAYLHLTEEEMANYLERSKILGEAAAMRWAVQQHPPADP